MADPKWYSLQLALADLSETQAAEVIMYLEDELRMRPHLRQPEVTWEADNNRAVVKVALEALHAGQATAAMSEELFEASCAILTDPAGIRIELLDAVKATT